LPEKVRYFDNGSEKDKGRNFQRGFFQRLKNRPFTPEEKGGISSRLDSLERDINRIW
jgi:hypothetical protein